MALTYDLTACADSDFLMTDKEWPVTQSLIFSTMSVGIGKWTDKNIAEVYARIRFLEKHYGAFMFERDEKGNRKDYFFTKEDITRRIGLETNVFPAENRRSFISRHVRGFFRDQAREFSKAS